MNFYFLDEISHWYDKPEIWIPIIISFLSLLGLGTLTSLLWKDLINKRKANSVERKAQEKEERIEEMRTVTDECWDKVEKRLKAIEVELKLNSTGTQAGLRNHLLNVYYDCVKKGYRTKNDSENFRDMYAAYHDLGGNSFIENDVLRWFEEIPSKEEYQKNI